MSVLTFALGRTILPQFITSQTDGQGRHKYVNIFQP